MDGFLRILEWIGVVSFAISGAMVAIRKHMDLFGVIFMGILTAVGGGVIRDLMIGLTPPSCFRDPLYIRTAFLTSLLFFLPFLRRPMLRHQVLFDRVMFLTDSLGLGLFVVGGVELALKTSPDFSPDLLLFIGMVSGTGGSVMRDVIAGDTPQIFVKHVYAVAALAGAAAYLALRQLPIHPYAALMLSAALIFILRCLAAHYRWNLPRAEE